MTTHVWRGDAQGRAQVTRLSLDAVDIGYVCTVTCNRKDVSVTAASASLEDLYALLAAAITSARDTITEFSEMTATVDTVDGVAIGVKLTGADDGTPFTVTATSDLAFTVGVVEATKGAAQKNEIQQVTLNGSPSSGTFTLTYGGATTSSIAYNANAAAVQSALEALSTIGSGNVSVTGSSPAYVVEFTGTLAATNVSMISGDGSSLNGAEVTPTVVTEGRASTNKIYRISPLVASGTFVAIIFPPAGDPIPGIPMPGVGYVQIPATSVTASANTLRGAIASKFGGTANVLVTKDGDDFLVEFTGAAAGYDVTMLATQSGSGATVTIGVEQDASATGANEVQSLLIENGPTGGTYTLTFAGQTTSSIAYNANAAAVQSALEGLSNIGTGDVEVTGASPQFTVTFKGALAETDVAKLTADVSSLTGSSIGVIVSQLSFEGASETQSIYIDGTPTGGTFALTFSGQTTSGIAYNASAGTVQSALEALSNIAGSGADISVTGSAGGPWLVTFVPGGAYAYADVPLISADGDLLTASVSSMIVTDVVDPTGPAWIDNPENWGSNSLPASGDSMLFANTDRSALYGLENLTLTHGDVLIDATFTGRIGLPYYNGSYIEYRPRYLKYGTAGSGRVSNLWIGRGEGDGSDRILIDTNDVHTNLYLQQAAQATGDEPAVCWLGTHASNAVYAYRGTLGIAYYSGEVATVSVLKVAYVGDVEADAIVHVGSGVTLATVAKIGGTAFVHCAIGTAFVNEAGAATIDGTGAVAGLKVRGGEFAYRTSGTLSGTTIVSGGGILTFEGDLRPKTVANPIEVYGDAAEVRDPNYVASTSGFSAGEFVVDFNETTRFAAFGSNHRLVRSAL